MTSWTEERINTVVTREYITSRLPAKRQDLLHRPLAFGDGLTDDTYLEWIVEKGKRLFLIFEDLGIPEWIFEAVDRAVDDGDLPLDEQAIWDLNLSHGKTNSLDKLFFRRQHKYIVKILREGEHVEYAPTDIVPVELIARKSGRLTATEIDQVRLDGVVYKRRTFALGEDENLDPKQFVLHLKALQRLKHPHMISIFTSYTQGDCGYALLAPATNVTLKSFLEDPPKSYKQLSKAERRGTLLRWMHRLSHALAYLHEQGYAHQAIRPSNIYISPQNRIFLGEPAALDILQGRGDNGREMYEYSSPEQWQRKPVLQEVESDKLAQPGGGRKARRLRYSAPPSSFSPARPSSAVSDSTVRESASWHRSSRRSSGSGNRTSYAPTIASMHAPSTAPTTSSATSDSSGSTVKKRTIITTFTPNLLPSLFPSDVFSLCAVHVHLLSAIFSHASDSHFASKFSNKSLRSYISKRNRSAGRGGAPADSSFHANLSQVYGWIEKVEQGADAKRKKGKDNGTWEAVGGLAWVIRTGLRKNATERTDARELVKHIRVFIGSWGDSRPTSREEMRSMGDEAIEEEEEEEEEEIELPAELSAVRSAETTVSESATIQLDRYESSSSNETREDDTWSAPEEGGSSSLSEDFTPIDTQIPAAWPLPARKTANPVASHKPPAKMSIDRLRTDRELLTQFLRD